MSILILDPDLAPPGFQSDVFRLITRDQLGRPTTLLDLNDPASIYRERGTFKINPGARRERIYVDDTRYGGETVAEASRGNATVSATLVVKDETSHLVAADRVEELLRIADRVAVAGDLYVQVRPQPLDGDLFLPVRGPATVQPTYESHIFRGARLMRVEVSWPCAPLAEGPPMDVTDDFTGTLEEYELGAGATPDLYALAGGLHTVGTADGIRQQVIHAGRGYYVADGETTAIGQSNSGGSNHALTPGLAHHEVDGAYLWATVEDGNLRIYFFSGTGNVLVASAVGVPNPLFADVTYAVVIRKVADLISAEFWIGRPMPGGTPNVAVSITLTGATVPTAAMMGAGRRGRPLARSWTPAAAATATVQEFRWRPYTFPASAAPASRVLRDVPGTAPAKIAVEVASTVPATSRPFGLIAWRQSRLRAGARAPFGVVLADTDDSFARVGFAPAAIAGTLDGIRMQLDAAASLTGTLEWLVDADLLDPDEPGGGRELDVEVWAMGALAAGVLSPRLTVSNTPDGLTVARSYTREFGSAGRQVVRPVTGTRRRTWRLGTLTFDAQNRGRHRIRLAALVGAGSIGILGVEYLVLTPSSARAASPSGLVNDSAYPVFLPGQAVNIAKRIRSGLSGALITSDGLTVRDGGIAGEPLEVPPGDVELLAWAQAGAVPDDPTSGDTEALDGALAVHASVTPRYRLFRTD